MAHYSFHYPEFLFFVIFSWSNYARGKVHPSYDALSNLQSSKVLILHLVAAFDQKS